MISNEEYTGLREEARNYFECLPPTRCPAFSEEVIFSAEGFNHIVYKRGSVERDRVQQMNRFKLLPLAVRLVSLSTTYQEYEEREKVVRVRRYGKRIKEARLVRYWGVIAIIDERKIKVVLRKVGNGELHFWSIIPGYSTSAIRDERYMNMGSRDVESLKNPFPITEQIH